MPVIGCSCPVCSSNDPRNTRTRCSLHIRSPQSAVLIDSGPDLREQALREGFTALDAVLFTHAHVDHVAGFDELRAFCWHREGPLPMYGGSETLATLKMMFPWAFKNTSQGYVRPDPREINGPFTVGDLTFTPLPVEHAGFETFGFRVQTPCGHSFAYLCDVKSIPEATHALMHDLDVLIIDALRHTDHPTHMTVAEALTAVDSLAPRQTFLTHLTHDLDFARLSSELPPNVAVAFDGLKFAFQPGETCAIVTQSPE